MENEDAPLSGTVGIAETTQLLEAFEEEVGADQVLAEAGVAEVLEDEEVSLVAEGDLEEVELETKKSLALSSKKPIKSDINLFYLLIITQ